MKKLKWVNTFNAENHDHVFKVNSTDIKILKAISSEEDFNILTTYFQILLEEKISDLSNDYIVTLKIIVDSEEIPENWEYVDTVYDSNSYCYSIYLSSIEICDNQKFIDIETGMVPPYIEYLKSVESKGYSL